MNGRWTLAPVSSTRPVGRVEADLLVACDGVHSVVRRTLYPDEGPPKWNGITMWRALPLRSHDDDGRALPPTDGHLPDLKTPRGPGPGAHQLGGRAQDGRRPAHAQAGLGAHRPSRGRARAVRLVCLRLPQQPALAV